jgi:hypothetical protein
MVSRRETDIERSSPVLAGLTAVSAPPRPLGEHGMALWCASNSWPRRT